MSGGPNPNQIAELLQAASMVRELDEKRIALDAAITQAQKDREAVTSSRRRNAEKIVKLFTSMDCASDRNVGWESRVVELFSEVATQSKAPPC